MGGKEMMRTYWTCWLVALVLVALLAVTPVVGVVARLVWLAATGVRLT